MYRFRLPNTGTAIVEYGRQSIVKFVGKHLYSIDDTIVDWGNSREFVIRGLRGITIELMMMLVTTTIIATTFSSTSIRSELSILNVWLSACKNHCVLSTVFE